MEQVNFVNQQHIYHIVILLVLLYHYKFGQLYYKYEVKRERYCINCIAHTHSRRHGSTGGNADTRNPVRDRQRPEHSQKNLRAKPQGQRPTQFESAENCFDSRLPSRAIGLAV